MLNDEVPLSQFLSEELRTKWAISRNGFSDPSWNILRRAMMKFDFGGVDYPKDYIEVEILENLSLLDVRQVQYAGQKRIDDLIQELGKFNSVNVAKNEVVTQELKNDAEIKPDSTNPSNLHEFILTEILISDNWRNEFFNKYAFHFEYSFFENESIAREISIFESRVNGETLAQIGNRFGVTRERIRQIVEKAFSRISSNHNFEGKSISMVLNQRKKSQQEQNNEAFESSIRNLLNTNPGIKYLELADLLNSDVTILRSHISYQASKFVYQEQAVQFPDPQFSDEFILNAMKMAAAIRSPLSAPMYENLVERGLVKGPRSQIIAKRFGTWSNACINAGVMFVHSLRGEYTRTWSEEEVLEYLVSFLKNKEFGIGVISYEDWRAIYGKDAPSSPHIRNLFGTWINAKNSALSYMNKHNITCDLT